MKKKRMNGFKSPFILLKDLKLKKNERGKKNDNDRFNT